MFRRASLPLLVLAFAIGMIVGSMLLPGLHLASSRGECGQTVIVSTQDIPPGTKLDPLIAHGLFKSVCVPADALISGAIVTTNELQGQTTAAAIYANEQIPTSRLVGIP